MTINNLKYRDRLKKENKDLKQKLEKIKPILEYYSNSTIGELQADGTYKFCYTSDIFGVSCINYDPRKAKEGLQIIESEEIKR